MSTKLVNNSQVQQALKVKGFWGSLAASAAMSLSGLNRINRIYSPIAEYQGIEFAGKLLERLNIRCNYIPKELNNIPKEGPFIIVSNHPFGAIDGIMMLNIIGAVRPDLKILTNFLLSYIPNLSSTFFPVNPFTNNPGLRSSFSGLKMATAHLNDGGALGLFPSGEVSSNANKERIVKDIEWQPSIIKLIQRAGVPVIPIFFEGQNSALFHFLGKIHPLLRTVRLPHELSNKKNKDITLRIGYPISPSEIDEFATIRQLGEHLWNRCYSLEANIPEAELSFRHKRADNPDTTSASKIIDPVEPALLKEEILRNSSSFLFETGSYACYLMEYDDIPNIMREIGRKREIAFRSIGEGTNRELDTDKYDTYYKHLVLWDKENSSVVGAYRLGFCSGIIRKFGIKGLYSSTLFKYRKEFRFKLYHSIELGRSFVAVEYQKDPIALMLLIKGLLYTVIKNREIRYLIGPVSISSWYPPFYKSAMIYYLKKMHSIPQLKEMITPRTPFIMNFGKVNPEHLLDCKMQSLEKFDRFLYRISNSQYRLPTLLKKYLKINARIIDYNVDPDFNYCIDGLIMLAINEVPRSEIDALSKEFENKEELYRRFDIEAI